MKQNVVEQIEAAHTVEEVAGKIKYHPESVRRLIRQGRIHALPFGTSWRVSHAELVRILTEGLPYSSTTAAGGTVR